MLSRPVSYELALFAKVKGFDEDLNAFYNADKEVEEFLDGWKYSNSHFAAPWFVENHPNGISAPTLDELTSWLRNKHQIHLQVDFFSCKDFGDRYHWSILTKHVLNEHGGAQFYSEESWLENVPDNFLEKSFSTYEDAQEVGLDKALSLVP